MLGNSFFKKNKPTLVFLRFSLLLLKQILFGLAITTKTNKKFQFLVLSSQTHCIMSAFFSPLFPLSSYSSLSQ